MSHCEWYNSNPEADPGVSDRSSVVLADINFPSVESLAQELNNTAGKTVVVAMKCDAVSWDDTVAMFNLAEKSFKTGRIDFGQSSFKFVQCNADNCVQSLRTQESPKFPSSLILPSSLPPKKLSSNRP